MKKLKSLILILYSVLFKRGERMPEDDVLSLFDNKRIQALEKKVSEKDIVNVGFFCMSEAMWKYDTVFQALKTHPHFNPIIIIAPREGRWSERKKNIEGIRKLCLENNYKYISLKNDFFNIGQNISKYNLDIAFFTQPYADVISKEYSFDKLRDTLLCYVPYGYYLAHQEFCYASTLNKIAWRNFYPSQCTYDEAISFGQSGRNITITGYPAYDMYKNALPMKWKQSGKKKIIWAPHFSVASNGWMHLSCFMEVSEYMLKLASKYSEKLQIAFKPHPHLYSALCAEWGEEKAKSYYHNWEKGQNTMLCNSDNYALFKSSDAMIHDSGSFVMEYLYTQKPCMYLYLNGRNNFNLNEAGIEAMNAHYKAYTISDIEKFVEMILDGSEDPLSDIRSAVMKKYIIPQNGKSATVNIIEELENL